MYSVTAAAAIAEDGVPHNDPDSPPAAEKTCTAIYKLLS